MPTLGDKKKPVLLRAVDKPANVGTAELAAARPVYIDGAAGGGASEIADITGLQAIIDDLTDRVAALEAAGA